MTDSDFYMPGSRQLQDSFDSRRIADRLRDIDLIMAFTDQHRKIIEAAPMFFLATADHEGQPDVSYKGGLPGFVRVTGPSSLAYPDYNGNGMFKSLGTIIDQPKVALLFVSFADPVKKLRVLGRASVSADDSLMGEFPKAQLIVRIEAETIFDNCPRYIHQIEIKGWSRFAPRAGEEPPIPDWKRHPDYMDALPKKDLDALKEE